jgi:hypothetical protein
MTSQKGFAAKEEDLALLVLQSHSRHRYSSSGTTAAAAASVPVSVPVVFVFADSAAVPVVASGGQQLKEWSRQCGDGATHETSRRPLLLLRWQPSARRWAGNKKTVMVTKKKKKKRG